MRLIRRLAAKLALAVGSGVLAVAVSLTPAAAAAPVACPGTVRITPTAVSVSSAGPVTRLQIAYVGTHTICLADGSLVPASLSGVLIETIGVSGNPIHFRFAELASYGGGAISYRGDAVLTSIGWQSAVRTVGFGTGPLAGIEGQGRFTPTSQTTFDDVIYYTYH